MRYYSKYISTNVHTHTNMHVFLKPKFRTGNSAQQNVVLFTAMPYIAFAAQHPCSSFIQLPSPSVAVESQTNPASAIVLSAEKDACGLSTHTAAVNAAHSAKKVLRGFCTSAIGGHTLTLRSPLPAYYPLPSTYTSRSLPTSFHLHFPRHRLFPNRGVRGERHSRADGY